VKEDEQIKKGEMGGACSTYGPDYVRIPIFLGDTRNRELAKSKQEI
jgi:hypothetical protein